MLQRTTAFYISKYVLFNSGNDDSLYIKVVIALKQLRLE